MALGSAGALPSRKHARPFRLAGELRTTFATGTTKWSPGQNFAGASWAVRESPDGG